jgi:hypothetical protein
METALIGYREVGTILAEDLRRGGHELASDRLSWSGPPALDGEPHPHRDVTPFARRVVEEFPERVLWGTDWPHPNLKDHMPDDGVLVDLVPHVNRRIGVDGDAQPHRQPQGRAGRKEPG